MSGCGEQPAEWRAGQRRPNSPPTTPANQCNWTASTVVMACTTAATAGRPVIGFVWAINAGARCRNRLGQQRLMLRRAEEPGVGITASRLPTCDDGAGRLVEPSIDLGIEAEPGQPALHVATLCLVKADLILGFLSALLDNFGRIGGGQQLAVGHARAGFGNICTDENCKDGQCENEDAQWLIFPDL